MRDTLYFNPNDFKIGINNVIHEKLRFPKFHDNWTCLAIDFEL